MYWWRIEDLRTQLVTGSMTERERFNYVMADGIVTGLLYESAPWWSDANEFDALLALISVVSTIAGTVWAFRHNGGSHGRNFLERFVSLGWVVAIRVIAFGALLTAFAMIFFTILGHEWSDGTGPFDVVAEGGMVVAFWVVLGRELRKVRAAEELTGVAAGV